MLYNIATAKSANESLVRLTGYTAKQIESFIQSYDDNDAFLLDVLQNNGITVPQLDDIQIYITHITTSVDSCRSIRETGLLCLHDVLQIDKAELTSFLTERGITIDVEKKRLSYRDTIRDINFSKGGRGFMDSIDINPARAIGRKIYYDCGVCGFCHINPNRPYGSPVHHYPEILDDIDKALGSKLKRDWNNRTQSYSISFYASLSEIEYIDKTSLHECANEDLYESLVEFALDIASGCRNELIAQCMSNTSIAPENLTIKPFTEWSESDSR